MSSNIRSNRLRRRNRVRRELLWLTLYHNFFSIGRCYWCNKQIKYHESILDHDPPLALGGGEQTRGVISCVRCDKLRSKELSKALNVIPDYVSEDKSIELAWAKSMRLI